MVFSYSTQVHKCFQGTSFRCLDYTDYLGNRKAWAGRALLTQGLIKIPEDLSM